MLVKHNNHVQKRRNSPVFSSKEIQDLHKRIAELEKENLFLKKAAAFFAREADEWCNRFIVQYKTILGLRWLLRKFQVSPNAYYNYLKQRKAVYQQQKNQIKEKIKQIYYNNNRLPGHRVMRIFLLRRGICLSKTTVHKYRNKELSLHAIVRRKKPRYVRGTKIKSLPTF